MERGDVGNGGSNLLDERQPQPVRLTSALVYCTAMNLGGVMASKNCN